MRLVLVESPFAGRSPGCVPTGGRVCRATDAKHNLDYVKALCRYLSLEGMAPYASHIFCTQFLDDTIQVERAVGIEIGLRWGTHAEASIVGIDRGVSTGMRLGVERARQEGRAVEFLSLVDWKSSWLPSEVERCGWRELVRVGDKVNLFGKGWSTWSGE